MPRRICDVARDITKDWKKVNFAAKPYLDAMQTLAFMHDKFGCDDAKTIILYFLSNAGGYRGPKAAMLKLELKEMLREEFKSRLPPTEYRRDVRCKVCGGLEGQSCTC